MNIPKQLESKMNNFDLQWVIRTILARSCRPCYHDDAPSAFRLNEWLKEVSLMKIQSILCLLSQDELDEYYGVYGIDLLVWYRSRGLAVGHVPVSDHFQPPLRKLDLVEIQKQFKKLSAPCLIHCSAGIDRTGEAIKVIQTKFLK